MRRPIPLTVILTVVALALVLPASTVAAGSTSDRIYYDCEHSPTGYLTGHYSKRALRSALSNPPADVSEYSGCYDAIRQALLASSHPSGSGGSGGGTGVSGGGGSTGGGGLAAGGGATGGTVTPAHVGTKAPVTLAGTTVRPGAIPTIGRDTHGLPTPLIVLLALLGAAVLAAVTTTMGRRVVAHRRA